MKLLDIIFEDEDKDKLIKRGNTIYKGFKTGTIRKGHFGKIMYELPDVYDIQLDINDDIFIKSGGNGTDNEIKFYYVDRMSGEIKTYSLNNHEYHLFVREIERNKFKSFGIVVWYEQSENINENKTKSSFKIKNERNINQEELDKSVKKLKVIYKALKKGKITINDNDGPEKKYRYVLNDIYALIVNDVAGTRMIIAPEGLLIDGAKYKLYEIQPNGEEVFIEKDKNLNRFLYTRIWGKIVRIFHNYDTKVVLR